MYDVIPLDVGSMSYALAAGISSFVISIVFLAIVFGLKIKDIRNNMLSLAIYFFLSLSIPVTVLQMNRATTISSTAQSEVKINNIGTINVNKTTVIVNIVTNVPISAYLEYKDYTTKLTTPIIPEKGLTKNTNHTFTIYNVGPKGGEANIVIDGMRFLIDGKPIIINQPAY